ncbi:sigma-70 family RNA polymerase sigma factor [Planctomycetales bacterium ZRK34]|nr:sigma-70 family RNA polymerase sigma factor [Planctomycetales bacterium ZRK34]
MAADRNRILKTIMADRMRLFSYIWVIVRDEHIAEDVLQDVWILATEKIDDTTDIESLRVWIRRAARNKALQAVQQRTRDQLVFSPQTLDNLDAAWGMQDSTRVDETITALRMCLEKLSPYARRVVELRYVEGLTGTRLAEALNRNLTAAYVAVSRINKTLAECVRNRMAEDRS